MPLVNVPDTLRVTVLPEVPEEAGKVRSVLVVEPAARLPRLMGRDVVGADPFNVAFLIVRLEAVR